MCEHNIITACHDFWASAGTQISWGWFLWDLLEGLRVGGSSNNEALCKDEQKSRALQSTYE